MIVLGVSIFAVVFSAAVFAYQIRVYRRIERMEIERAERLARYQ